mgnify:CR=1 FL=1
MRSHPSRVRGLKLVRMWDDRLHLDVAPLAGAWIETERTYMDIIDNWKVAPLAGAWIETEYGGKRHRPHLSHPSRVRGLKHRYSAKYD